jgi:hypothetical protein
MAIVIVAVVLVNGVVMIISPTRRFKLPSWLRAQGTLTEEHYTRGLGSIQIRLLGAAFVAFICWMGYGLLRGPK